MPKCFTFEGHSGEGFCIIYPALVPLLFYCEVFQGLLIRAVVWALWCCLCWVGCA